ncbi:MAG TPA: SDR family NAD(P)-dependent oxidoreductase [Burkholderiaceae bacterium]
MNATTSTRPLAVVTGASSGIGLELARLAAREGHDLVVAADGDAIHRAAEELRSGGADVQVVQADLATRAGCEQVLAALGGRPVAALMANAGHGLGEGFLDQKFEDIEHLVDTNIMGTLMLVHAIGRGMRQRGEGRILLTGSIAGLMPGSFQAVYNASKAFVDSFSFALRNELKDSGVTVTCLMPGPTETNFFEHAGLQDTQVGTDEKADPADVAKDGFEAMKKGEQKIVSGWKNKLQAAMAHVTPDSVLAQQHRKMAEPGTAKH